MGRGNVLLFLQIVEESVGHENEKADSSGSHLWMLKCWALGSLLEKQIWGTGERAETLSDRMNTLWEQVHSRETVDSNDALSKPYRPSCKEQICTSGNLIHCTQVNFRWLGKFKLCDTWKIKYKRTKGKVLNSMWQRKVQIGVWICWLYVNIYVFRESVLVDMKIWLCCVCR